MSADLSAPVQYVKGIGPGRAARLAALGVRTVRDLLYHLPSGYLDRGSVIPIRAARPGRLAMLRGTLTEVGCRRGMLTARLEDASGSIALVWFHAPEWLKRRILPGARVLVTGTVALRRGLQIAHPSMEPVADGEPAGILPCYPLTAGITDRLLRAALPKAVACHAALLPEFLPEGILSRHGLLGRPEALRAVHAPRGGEHEAGRRRLAYDELFLVQLALAVRRRGAGALAATPLPVSEALHARILRRLPFAPTSAQARAFRDLRADLARPRPMHRLLQGDVGSGKTAVAAYAMLAAVANGAQAVLLAPTEILAEQHMRTLGGWLKGSRVRLELLRGGLRAAGRRRILEGLASGEAGLVVGTHALLDLSVRFARLGLAVVDESHRFGVLQRERLRLKGASPHVLVMTATPIPNTLAMTIYGDLDTTLLDERPPGRRPVETRIVPSGARAEAFDLVRRELARGRQAFFTAPLIDKSDRVAAASALRLHQEVRSAFPGTRVLFLHGRLPPAGKEQVMEDFRAGRAPLLVSTQVVEVGVDVPNASVMVVESAERYGLAQLHQLRGRIGRGRHPSFCLLLALADTERLQILAATEDGFRIAEEDLRLRGPGEFLGTRQHGMPDLRVADLARDAAILKEAREDAFAAVEAHTRDGEEGFTAAMRAAMQEHFGTPPGSGAPPPPTRTPAGAPGPRRPGAPEGPRPTRP